MSKFVSIKTSITDVNLLHQSLAAMKCEILPHKRIRTLLNVHYDVDIAVKTAFGIVGFIKNTDDVYEWAGDDTVLERNKSFLEQLTQKYAYTKITAEAKKAGYQIIKEQNQQDQTIRLVFRKWNG